MAAPPRAPDSAAPLAPAEARPELSRRQTALLVASLMLGMALIAVDVTLVGTAMPTIVGSLGGVGLYSWVIAAYLLTSTTTVPIYGRLSDLYGRKPVFLFGISVFLLGSALCGTASSMEQLVAYRAVQGLGAGAIQPMTMTIMGDAFGVERRARMQAFISAVWGVSSFVGPAMGALIVTYAWWNLVFFVNIPVGAFALAMILGNYHETVEHRERSIDWLGGILLTVGVTALLFAFQRSGSASGGLELGGLYLLAAVLLGLFALVEVRAADPIISMELLRHPVIGVSYLASFMAGAAQFGVNSFLPLFVQGPMGGTAAEVGLVLAPMSIGWPLASILAGRLVLRVGYRRILIGGWVALASATVALLTLGVGTSALQAMAIGAVFGMGMGLTWPPTTIAIQNAVTWRQRGTATSLAQFSRSIGGSCGVAIMGAVLNFELARQLAGTALPPGGGSFVSQILDPSARAAMPPDTVARVQQALAATLQLAYAVPIICALAGLALILWKFPAGSVQELGVSEARGASTSANPESRPS